MRKALRPGGHVIAAVSCFLLWPQVAAAGEPLRLLSGTPVALELQHHITSAYTPAGSTLWFHVAEDVVAGEGVAIRKDTPVRGRMRSTSDRGRLGTSGSMDFTIDFVTAADGQQVRVVSDESRDGRDRGNALVGWTIFWGLPGLLTRGVHGWLERGARVEALVLHDRRIAVAQLPPAAAQPEPPVPARGRITAHRFSTTRAPRFRLDFERDTPLGTVVCAIEPPPGLALDPGELAGLQLVAVDGVVIDEPVPVQSARAGSVAFDNWSVLRYCRHGATTLRLAGVGPAGEPIDFEYVLDVEFRQ